MVKRSKKTLVLIAALAAISITTVAAKDLLTDLLKIGGVGLVVDRFGPQINDALNKVQNLKTSEAMMTKVVPILSIGMGKFIGAAQVMGPARLVNKVKAVAQVETKFLGTVRLKALIPVESKEVIKDIHRVVGVGVSGIVDLKI